MQPMSMRSSMGDRSFTSSAYNITFSGTSVTTTTMGTGTSSIAVGNLKSIPVSASPCQVIAVGKFADGSSQIVLDTTI